MKQCPFRAPSFPMPESWQSGWVDPFLSFDYATAVRRQLAQKPSLTRCAWYENLEAGHNARMDIHLAKGSFLKWRASPIQTLSCLLVGAGFFIGIAMKDPRTPPAAAWAGALMMALSLIFDQVRIQEKDQSRPERLAACFAEVVWTVIVGVSVLIVFSAAQTVFSATYANAVAADWELAWQWALGIVGLEALYFTAVHAIRFVRADTRTD